MELTRHLSVIWARRWQVLGASLGVALLVFVWSAKGDDVYAAKSQLTVTVAQTQSGTGSPTQEITDLVTSGFATVATSNPVLDAARKASRLDLTLDAVDSLVSVSPASGSGFLTVVARGRTTDEALALNQALVRALIDQVVAEQGQVRKDLLAPIDQEITDLRGELASLAPADPLREGLLGQLTALLQVRSERQLQPVHRIDVLNPPTAEPDPVAPLPRRDAMLALVVALVVNSELAVVFAALGDRVSSERQLTEALAAKNLPVLGRVPQSDDGVNLVESFRELRTNLLLLDLGRVGASLAVLGAEPTVGKSFVSINLAQSFAHSGQRTVLIDGDLRSPSIHPQLGLRRSPGLSEVASFDGPLNLQSVPGESDLKVLTAGEAVADPAAVASGLGIEWAVAQLSEDALVIVDTPPVNLFSDAAAIARHCSAYVLVVDLQRTRHSQLERALSRLEQTGALPVGAVLNRVVADDRRYEYAQEAPPPRRGWVRGLGKGGAATKAPEREPGSDEPAAPRQLS